MRRLLLAVAVLAALVAGPALLADGGREEGSGGADSVAIPRPSAGAWPGRAYPGRAELARARAYGVRRSGAVSFALLEPVKGLRGLRPHRRYFSASITKAPLLVAELRRLRDAGEPLDPSTRQLLIAMVTASDNDAADAIYARVGDPGLLSVARLARMPEFDAAGHWSIALLSAADMVRFFAAYRRLTPGRYRPFASRLFRSVIPVQRWGIPQAAQRRWRVETKGGWRPESYGHLVHQAALLRHGPRRLALAVMTTAQPSLAYGTETIRGVARRLLSAPRRPRGWAAA